MPQSMSKTQILRFTRICEDQGIRVTRTKKGLLLRFPDGSSTVQHFTNSDMRAESNQIARFRRAGMVHPNDTREQKEGLPSYITSGTISEKTKARIVEYVASQGYPEAVLSSSVVKDLKMDPGWANRALYHSGFRPGKAKSRKIGRPWYTPDEILCLKESPVVAEELAKIVDDEDEPDLLTVAVENTSLATDDYAPEVTVPIEVEQMPIYEEPVVEEEVDRFGTPMSEQETPAVDDLQYIDTRESWTIDPEELFGTKWKTFMKDELRVLKAMGIEYEIRVWRSQTT